VTLHGCTVGNRCLIGMGSVILNHAQIGEGSIIAAGTVIPENAVIEPYSLWMGVPGKFRRRTDDETSQQMILQYAKNYVDYTESYRKEFRPDGVENEGQGSGARSRRSGFWAEVPAIPGLQHKVTHFRNC